MTRRLSSLLSDLSEALENEHYNCEDNTCDISAAMRQGLYLWAAELLTGATECEATERAYARYRSVRRPAAFERALEAEREELCALPRQECVACGSTVWNDEDETCGNCLAKLPRVFWRLRFASFSGMSGRIETTGFAIPDSDSDKDNKREVMDSAIGVLRSRVKTGHAVKRIKKSDTEINWECGEPEGSVMVPDTAGILVLERIG